MNSVIDYNYIRFTSVSADIWFDDIRHKVVWCHLWTVCRRWLRLRWCWRKSLCRNVCCTSRVCTAGRWVLHCTRPSFPTPCFNSPAPAYWHFVVSQGTKQEKNLVKPLYDRYQMIKHLLCASPTISTIVRHAHTCRVLAGTSAAAFSYVRTKQSFIREKRKRRVYRPPAAAPPSGQTHCCRNETWKRQLWVVYVVEMILHKT